MIDYEDLTTDDDPARKGRLDRLFSEQTSRIAELVAADLFPALAAAEANPESTEAAARCAEVALTSYVALQAMVYAVHRYMANISPIPMQLKAYSLREAAEDALEKQWKERGNA